jgi:hypothetical protein
MEYVGTSETQGPQFLFSRSDVEIIRRHIADGEPAALIASYLLQLKSIGESKVNGENILKVKDTYQKIERRFIDNYQKYKSTYSLSTNGRQPLLLASCTQDDMTKAYENQDTAFLVQLCEGILNPSDSLYFMEDDLDFENPKDSLLRALCEEEPQDLHQLEDMTGLDKTSIDNSLREFEDEGIVFSRYDNMQYSTGIVIRRRVCYLPQLWKSVYSIVFNSEL